MHRRDAAPWNGSTTTTCSTSGPSSARAASSAAAEKLRLSQPTVSAQVKALEESARRAAVRARRAAGWCRPTSARWSTATPTRSSRSAASCSTRVQGRATGRPLRLVVGVADVLSKLIAYRLLAPALRAARRRSGSICREARGRAAARRAGAARARPGARRHAGAADDPREGLQPPARRERRHLSSRAPALASPAAAAVPALADRRADAAARRRDGGAAAARGLVPGGRDPAGDRRRVRRQRADEGVRRTGRPARSSARRRSRPRSAANTASSRSAASTRSGSASTPSHTSGGIKHPAVVAIAEAARTGVLRAASPSA